MNVCDSLRNRLLEEGVSSGFETVASKRDKLEFVKKAKDKGYYIDFIFVSAGTPERCMKGCRNVSGKVDMMYQRRRYLPDTEGRWASYGNILKFQIMLMYGIILGMGWFCC